MNQFSIVYSHIPCEPWWAHGDVITSQVQRNNIKINTTNTYYAYIQQHSNIKNKTTLDHQHINQEEDGGLKK